MDRSTSSEEILHCTYLWTVVPPVCNRSPPHPPCKSIPGYPRNPQLPVQSRDGMYSTSSSYTMQVPAPPLVKVSQDSPVTSTIPGWTVQYLHYTVQVPAPPPPPPLSIPGSPSYLYNPGVDCTVPPVYSAST